MTCNTLLMIGLAALSFAIPAVAQVANPPVTSDFKDFLGTGEVGKGYLPLWSMAFGVLVLLFLFLLSVFRVINKVDTARYFILTLIVVCAMVFICGRFENSDIAPAIGLFGTIAGYVLGRTDQKEVNRGPVA